MKKFLKIILIMIISLFMFKLCINNTVYASATTTYDKKKSLSVEKQAEYDRVRNRNLKSLNIEGYDINPVFNKNTVDYYVIISTDVNSLKIEAIPENSAAKVTIVGNNSLKKPENEISIIVKSEKGIEKIYKIHVTKQKESNINLKSLEIDGYEFKDKFFSKKYNYDIELHQDEVHPLKINAKANNESAKIEIIGNDSTLMVGKNIITILVTKDSEIVTYQLNVSISTERKIIVNDSKKMISGFSDIINKIFKNNNSILAFMIAVAVVLIIIIIMLIRKIMKRKEGSEDD